MPKLFPTHFEINLDEHERSDLETLYENDIYLRDEVQLLHNSIRAGIKVLSRDTAEKINDAGHVTRTELEARTKPWTLPTSKFAGKAASDHENPSPPSRRVENYLGLPLSERLRRKLQCYVDQHPQNDVEDVAAALLEQALDRYLQSASQHHGDGDGGYEWGVQVFRQLRENLGLDDAPGDERPASSAETAKVAALAARLRKKWLKRG